MKALELPGKPGEKGVKGAKKRRAEAATAAAAAAADDGGFELNLADDRFGSIYQSSDFAIDPTDPKVHSALPVRHLPHLLSLFSSPRE